jgi:hypothetical protein
MYNPGYFLTHGVPMKRSILILCALGFVMTFTVSARWTQRKLRTKVRWNATSAGIDLSNCWTRIDITRKQLTTGGTVCSTNAQHIFFQKLTNCLPFLIKVDQEMVTPEPSLYPKYFTIGYNPYKREETGTYKEKGAGDSFTNMIKSVNKAFAIMREGTSAYQAVEKVEEKKADK